MLSGLAHATCHRFVSHHHHHHHYQQQHHFSRLWLRLSAFVPKPSLPIYKNMSAATSRLCTLPFLSCLPMSMMRRPFFARLICVTPVCSTSSVRMFSPCGGCGRGRRTPRSSLFYQLCDRGACVWRGWRARRGSRLGSVLTCAKDKLPDRPGGGGAKAWVCLHQGCVAKAERQRRERLPFL